MAAGCHPDRDRRSLAELERQPRYYSNTLSLRDGVSVLMPTASVSRPEPYDTAPVSLGSLRYSYSMAPKQDGQEEGLVHNSATGKPTFTPPYQTSPTMGISKASEFLRIPGHIVVAEVASSRIPTTSSSLDRSWTNSFFREPQAGMVDTLMNLQSPTIDCTAPEHDYEKETPVGSTFIGTAAREIGTELDDLEVISKATVDVINTQSSTVSESPDMTASAFTAWLSGSLHATSFESAISLATSKGETRTTHLDATLSYHVHASGHQANHIHVSLFPASITRSYAPTTIPARHTEGPLSNHAKHSQARKTTGKGSNNGADGGLLTGIGSKQYSGITSVQDVSQIPSMRQESAFKSVDPTHMGPDTSLLPIKKLEIQQWATPALKDPMGVSFGIGGGPSHPQTTQNWTDSTTVPQFLQTFVSSGTSERSTYSNTADDGPLASPTTTNGSSGSHNSKGDNVIISVSVVSAAAFLGISIFMLVQHQRKKQSKKRAEHLRGHAHRRYDPNCSYFSLDSTLD